MALIDRRIGWIFVAFLALLGIALARATYLGAVKAGSLQQAAVSQQITQDIVPASRGTITDRNGVQLAMSQSADDIIADPYLIKNPNAVAQKLAPLLGKPVLPVLACTDQAAHGVRVSGSPAAGRPGHTDREAPDQRHLDRARDNARLPAGLGRLAGVGRRPSQRPGQRRAGIPVQQRPAGRDGIRRIVNDAIGQPISINDVRPMRPGKTLELTLDASTPGRGGAGAGRRRARSTRPRGRPRS